MKEEKQHQIEDDSKWNDFYLIKPKEGQICMSKRKGEGVFIGECIFTNGYFETYRDHENRLEITRWKSDLWLPIK